MTDENQLRQLIKEELDSMYVPLRAQLQEIRDLLTETRRLQRQQIESELDGVHAPLTSGRKRPSSTNAIARGNDTYVGKVVFGEQNHPGIVLKDDQG
nr:hypothetical protein [Pseudomonas luteola]